jgi:acetylornithine deacetylase/succinyl-diaminopimelate desuccinylase-like protein
MKNHVVGVLESVETLLEEGFVPRRTVILCFGYNEELLDTADASAPMIAKTLEEKGIELTLDEIRRIKERAIKVQSGEDAQEQQEPLADGELSENELLDVAGGDGWTYTDVERWFKSW